jgi:hypothetical protein
MIKRIDMTLSVRVTVEFLESKNQPLVLDGYEMSMVHECGFTEDPLCASDTC